MSTLWILCNVAGMNNVSKAGGREECFRDSKGNNIEMLVHIYVIKGS